LRPQSVCDIASTVRIGEQPEHSVKIEAPTEAISEALGCVERNVVQSVQFTDDHQFQQLADADSGREALVMICMVDLLDEVA
jgi:hypothetical protein